MFHEKDADGRISRGTRREGRVSWRDASGPRSMRRGRLPSCADVGPTAVPAEGRRDRRRRSQWTSVGQLMHRCRLRHHRRRHGSHHVQELPRRPMQSKSLVPPPTPAPIIAITLRIRSLIFLRTLDHSTEDGSVLLDFASAKSDRYFSSRRESVW